MKKKIAFVEPFRHYEVLAALLRLLEGEDLEIQYFCTAFCQQQISLNSNSFSFQISPKEQLDDPFLEAHLEYFKSCDFIFFTTIDIHSQFIFHPTITAKCIGLVHNSHNFFFYKTIKVENQPKYLWHKLRGDFKKTNLVLKRLDRVVVPTKFIENYLRQKARANWHDKLAAIEIAAPGFKAVVHQQEKIMITIPGTINQGRRDYQLIADILSEVDQQIKTNVILVLLGKPFSKKEEKLIVGLKQLLLKQIELLIYEAYVPQAVFREVIEKTDFLLLPIQPKIYYKSFQEERGKTCVSGNINDMVQDALPAILPQFYPLIPELESLTARYKGKQELIQILADWINTQTFNKLKKRSDLSAYGFNAKQKLLSLFK